MIDENGKIGGKINLIDFLIVVVILAVVAFLGYRFLSNDDKEDTGEPVIIEFTFAEVNDYTVERLEIGAPVLDGNANRDLGTAVDFTIDDATTYAATDSGKTVLVDIPESKSVVVTVESTGELNDNGLLIDGTRYGIGYTTVVYVGRCKLWGTVSAITPA